VGCAHRAGLGSPRRGALAIVNVAGENLAGPGFLPSRWTSERKELIRRSRIDAGRAVVEAVEAAEVAPQVVVQASGIGHYGARGETPARPRRTRPATISARA